MKKGNELRVYEDNGDAWDFSGVYEDRPSEIFELVKSEVIVDGPKATIKQSYKYGDSTLVQEISILEGSKRIDFKTKVDWKKMVRCLEHLSILMFILERQIAKYNLVQ